MSVKLSMFITVFGVRTLCFYSLKCACFSFNPLALRSISRTPCRRSSSQHKAVSLSLRVHSSLSRAACCGERDHGENIFRHVLCRLADLFQFSRCGAQQCFFSPFVEERGVVAETTVNPCEFAPAPSAVNGIGSQQPILV